MTKFSDIRESLNGSKPEDQSLGYTLPLSQAACALDSMKTQEPIEILVSTFSALLHVLMDPYSLSLQEVRVVHEGAGAYYSTTWDDSRYYVLVRNYNQPILGNQILVFDRQFRQLSEMNCGGAIREGHQIRLVDGCLLICNTNNNCLTKVRLTDNSIEHFYPLSASRDSNFNHINSISFYGNRLWLVAANRYRNSFFMCFDYPSMALLEVDAVGLAAHNLIEWQEWRMTCDSYHGSLVLTRKGFDESKNEFPMFTIHLFPDTDEVAVERIVMSNAYFRERRGVPIFPRGLAVSGNLALVGISEITRRAMRHDSLSQIMAIEGLEKVLEGGKPDQVKASELGRYGAVMDVRILNRDDLGHAF
ncbi:hypothetical protein [Methylobacter sp.]|uniref:hypothetical protein n=1 Tax=Methylobacter sp. TaxID=2051955 RepID=UPI00121F108E|nr:hypothetical protein [Methylobacter sp.]TAK64229.1 MAG: hypothetical protein EPO18_04730 [Methylobacter sp.]